MKKLLYAWLMIWAAVLGMAVSAFAEDAAVSTVKINLTASQYYQGSSIILREAKTYYAAVYDETGERCSSIYPVTIGENRTNAAVSITADLKKGETYFLRMLQDDGTTFLPESPSGQNSTVYVTYPSESGQNTGKRVTVSSTGATVPYPIEVKICYTSISKVSARYIGSFMVSVENRNEAGLPTAATRTIYYRVSDLDKNKFLTSKVYAVNLADEASHSAKLSLMFNTDDACRRLRIVVTDKEGNIETGNEDYVVSYQDQDLMVTPSQQTIPVAKILLTKKKHEVITEERPLLTLTKVKAKKGRKVTLSWKAEQGVKKYQIQYARSKNFDKDVKVKTVSGTKVTLKKLKKKKTYYFRIRAFDGLQYGPWSAAKKVKVK